MPASGPPTASAVARPEASQTRLKFFEGGGAEDLPTPADHRESDGAIQLGQQSLAQPTRLALAQPQPNDFGPVLDLVEERDAITQQGHR